MYLIRMVCVFVLMACCLEVMANDDSKLTEEMIIEDLLSETDMAFEEDLLLEDNLSENAMLSIE